MASWLIELQARKAMPAQQSAGAKVAAAVMFSGGSHMCYLDPPPALSQCAKCTDGSSYQRLPPYTCSADVARNGTAPNCGYCCPTNVTELHYVAHPEDYPDHPPAFLVRKRGAK